ncbi:hypothetical protein [Streptomyces sp. NPDC057302]|uniref:hypothetical protein n=1 Tax=Streptomyces sp. NPDC057302 TaxID=3346094 RepID=UPI003640722A
MTRYTASNIDDDALDALYENASKAWRRGDRWKKRAVEAEKEHEQLLAELGSRDDEARERWIQKQLDETGLRAADFRNGMAMEIEPAREIVAHWVGAARAMLGDAPNYTETPIEMEVKVGESPERFAFVLQRVAPGALTPHQARQRAEAERDAAYRERAHLVALIAAMTDGAVIAPAADVDEPGWLIVFLTIGGRQASWHIAPRDVELFQHVTYVGERDPRAQWDGHTTDAKYEHIAVHTAGLMQRCGPECSEMHTETGRCEIARNR